MHTKDINNWRGITLIETLMAIGFLVIIAAFATPSISIATARADMHAASENLQYSIRIARNTARMTESEVTMNILEEGPDGQNQRITFTVSEQGLKALAQPGLQENRLPVGIMLVSQNKYFKFNERGFVENPGVITLVSRTNESLVTNFPVE
jgi:Tfp pilus assembly protein FimT